MHPKTNCSFMDLQTENYIKNHLNDDVIQLALNNKQSNINIQYALRQIKGYQVIKRKVPTWNIFDGLLYPTHISLEQCSSESTARFKAEEICKLFNDNKFNFVDLTCGLGVDAYFISQNAEQTILIEKECELAEITRNNFRVFKRDATVLNCESEDFLKTNTNYFDVIYIDPARRGTKGEKVVLLEDCNPNLLQLLPDLKQITKFMAVKLSPMFDIKQLISKLPGIKAIYSIGVNNECKEIFLIMDFKTQIPDINAVNISESNGEISRLKSTVEEEDVVVLSYPETLGEYLYEPFASFLKSGMYKTIANRYCVDKIHVNSHIYTSNNFIEDFPGRKFEIVETIRFGKREAKEFFEKYDKANITTRNFPMTADELRNKYKVKNGGENYVFATTIHPSTKVLICCKKK